MKSKSYRHKRGARALQVTLFLEEAKTRKTEREYKKRG